MAHGGWFREMAVYQIWTRSFCDGNGDGIGDLWGVLSKLDYIKSLNVDAIWFSPIYPSPNADYGYDISDYMNIAPEFGDLELFKKVLDGAHERGLRVFMDLVINHSSDEHPWFTESRRSKDSPYHDYYYWRPGKTVLGRRVPPNNWTSHFGGSAWEYDEGLDEYYLHIFAKKQPDLNMSNPAVRGEIKKILRFWLDMGVDGFREDVITFISKREGLPSDRLFPVYKGIRFYNHGPHIHEYLQEFRRDVLENYDCMTIAEAPLVTPQRALDYIRETGSNDMDMMIQFQCMCADCFFSDFMPRRFSLGRLRKAFSSWQTALDGQAWNMLYLENHDHPRVISRYGSEKYRVESGKMLAAMYILQRGTPFIYQGQEIGMTNLRLPNVRMYRDVQAKNHASILSKLLPEKKVLEIINDSSRDNARTPMQWSDERNAGFSETTPWFFVNPNYREVNVRSQEHDADSLLNFYRELLRFRREDPIAVYGDYRELMPRDKQRYVYERNYQGRRLLVICSFTSEQLRFEAPAGTELERGRLVFCNYETGFVFGNGFTMRPYELRVYLFE